MITKECQITKYACFYVSNYHLEMILLPYIKNKIDKSNIVIFTEENLQDTIKVLLNRINFKQDEKKQILNLHYWNNNKKAKINELDNQEYSFIVNGSLEYINKINAKINEMNFEKINIVDCYNINNKDLNISEIKANYEKVLNTQNI